LNAISKSSKQKTEKEKQDRKKREEAYLAKAHPRSPLSQPIGALANLPFW
jgi:hypothetical protein